MKLLKDGSGRACIHWFVRADTGKIVAAAALLETADGKLEQGPARGYVACAPKVTTLQPQTKNGTIHLTAHSDDVRAVTCPECRSTAEFKAAMAELNEMVDTVSSAENLKQWQTTRRE